jgi:hypothetical protein
MPCVYAQSVVICMCERWSIWSYDFIKVSCSHSYFICTRIIIIFKMSSLCNLLLLRQSIVIFLYKIVLSCPWAIHRYMTNSALICRLGVILFLVTNYAFFKCISAQSVCSLLYLTCQVSFRIWHVYRCQDNIENIQSDWSDLPGQSCDGVSSRHDNSALTSDFCWFAMSVRWLERLWSSWQQCPNQFLVTGRPEWFCHIDLYMS